MGKYLSNSEFQKRVQDMTNNEYNAVSSYVSSSQKIEMRHNKCGYVYSVTPNNFFKGRRCPYCAGKVVISGKNSLYDTAKNLAKEWNQEKNSISSKNVSANSNKKFWWICSKGHEWKATPNSRMRGVGCPICHQEHNLQYNNTNNKMIINLLSDKNIEIIFEYRIDNCRIDRPIPFSVGILKNNHLLGVVDYKTKYYSEKSYKVKNQYCKKRSIPYCYITLNSNDLSQQNLNDISTFLDRILNKEVEK